jgi:5-methylcytosine-specific restriction enzyme A
MGLPKPARNGNMDKIYPKRRDADGKPLCRYCGGAVPKPRRWWCSQDCVDNALIVCSPATAAAKTFKRDDRTCQDCGLKRFPKEVYEQYNTAREENRKKHGMPFLWRGNSILIDGYDMAKSFLECHHIVAVKDCGGECGLDNLITLCQRCHKKRHAKRTALPQEVLQF